MADLSNGYTRNKISEMLGQDISGNKFRRLERDGILKRKETSGREIVYTQESAENYLFEKLGLDEEELDSQVNDLVYARKLNRRADNESRDLSEKLNPKLKQWKEIKGDWFKGSTSESGVSERTVPKPPEYELRLILRDYDVTLEDLYKADALKLDPDNLPEALGVEEEELQPYDQRGTYELVWASLLPELSEEMDKKVKEIIKARESE